jgi:hypothetical protein
LVALERNDRSAWCILKSAQLAGTEVVTHGGVLGQVWRGRGAREARLAKALAGVAVLGLDDRLGRATGELLARARQKDVIDAAVVLLATDGDVVLTSDAEDLASLAMAAGLDIELVPT